MKVLLTPQGTAHYVYSDKLKGVPLGNEVKIKRATEVEYNHGLGQWEATDLVSGEIIATDVSRDQVIKEEVALLEKEMTTDHGQAFIHRNS